MYIANLGRNERQHEQTKKKNTPSAPPLPFVFSPHNFLLDRLSPHLDLRALEDRVSEVAGGIVDRDEHLLHVVLLYLAGPVVVAQLERNCEYVVSCYVVRRKEEEQEREGEQEREQNRTRREQDQRKHKDKTRERRQQAGGGGRGAKGGTAERTVAKPEAREPPMYGGTLQENWQGC